MSLRKKLVLLLALVPSLAFAGTNDAPFNDSFKDTYIAIGGGVSFPSSKVNHTVFQNSQEVYLKKKLKNSGVFKFALGKDFGEFRGELEYIYSNKHKLSQTINNYVAIQNQTPINHSLNTSHNTFFANVFYDFKGLNDLIVPYIGGGLGVSRNSISNEKIVQNGVLIGSYAGKKNTAFAWNVGFGTKINVNENLYFDIAYKFVDLGKIKGSTSFTTGSVKTQEIQNLKGHFRNNMLLLSVGCKF